MSRPPICTEGNVLVVSAGYPPMPAGSSVVMANLLSQFDPASYRVATVREHRRHRIEEAGEVTVHRVQSSVAFSWRLNRIWQRAQMPITAALLKNVAKRMDAAAIVAVFPELPLFAAARTAAKALRVPWGAYLHDTIVESLSGSPSERTARELQRATFEEASTLMAVSDGLADLYVRKYSRQVTSVRHPYMEEIPAEPPAEPALRQAFWAGAIYTINARALRRVAEGLRKIECPFVINTSVTSANLAVLGLSGDHVRTQFHLRRADYLADLGRQGLLVLALDGADESPIHEDELATIFPTKTPEYLASGRPILVHCPEHYYLARYFRERGCGLVVSERSVDALADAASFLLGDNAEVHAMRRAALAAARDFRAPEVASTFQRVVAATARAQWGQPAP